MAAKRTVPAVLSIAGSDSGGGAGVQADLKAFARCGVHGMTALTALTAQNTVAVTGVHGVPGEFIVEQVRAVASDIGVDAVKIGMLGTAETVLAVREALELLEPGTPVVLDPVMVAESGSVLLDEAAREAIVSALLPVVTVITPNLPEARVLAEAGGGAPGSGAAAAPAAGRGEDDGADAAPAAGRGEDDGADAAPAAGRGGDDAESLARALHTLGPRVVVVTGGHRDPMVDVFFDGETLERLAGDRHPDGSAHGSGCTHSSALAAHLALGWTPLEAARRARAVAADAVRDGLRELGAGPGPVNALGVGRGGRAAANGVARREAVER